MFCVLSAVFCVLSFVFCVLSSVFCVLCSVFFCFGYQLLDGYCAVVASHTAAGDTMPYNSPNVLAVSVQSTLVIINPN